MPDLSILWLRLAAALYGVGLLDSILTVLRRESRLFPLALRCFAAAVLFHSVAVVEMSARTGHLAANNFFETASLCALLIAVVYLFIYWRYEFAGMSVFLFPLVFLLTMIGAMGEPVAPFRDPRVSNAWLLIHIVLVLAGYAALLVSSGAAVFYLLQERRLKRKKSPGGIIRLLSPDRLPPLDVLDSLITKSMSIGFVCITVAVVAGSTWAFVEFGTRWIREAKIAISLVTWAFYLLMVFLRVAAGWRGRRAAVLSLTVLGFAALTWAAHVGLRPMLER